MSASENPRSKALQKKTLMTSSYDGVSDANDEDSRVRDERVLRKVWRVEPQGDRAAYEKVYVRHDEVYQMGERDKDRERRRGGGMERGCVHATKSNRPNLAHQCTA